MKNLISFVSVVFVTCLSVSSFAQYRQAPQPFQPVVVAPITLPMMPVAPIAVNRNRMDMSIIIASLAPMAGSNVTFVENNTNAYMFDIIVASASNSAFATRKRMVIMDFNGRIPEVGLPPQTKAWYRNCSCGEKNGVCIPFIPGMNKQDYCHTEVHFKTTTWDPTVVATYTPTGYSGIGCQWQDLEPFPMRATDNAIVIEQYSLGAGCR